jgi:multiple sugar transport system ATP-binding protein
MNLIQGTLSGDAANPRLEIGGQTLALPAEVLTERPALASRLGSDVVVGIRPEDMEDSELVEAPEGSGLTSTADLVEAMGSDVLVHFAIEASQVVTEDTRELARDAGTDVLGHLENPRTDLVARFSPRTRVKVGDPVKIRVDTGRLHFFDIESGAAIWGSDAAGPLREDEE